MSKTNEARKNITAKNSAKQTANETSQSFIERNKSILLGTIAGLTISVGLSAVSSLSVSMVAVIGASCSFLVSYLSDAYIPQSISKAVAETQSHTISLSKKDELNFRKETYKKAYEIELANTKRNKKNNAVITKFEKLVSEAEKKAPVSEQSTKNLLNIYKRGTQALHRLHNSDVITHKIKELENQKRKLLKK